MSKRARYGRPAAEPAPGELEQFFHLDAKMLESARAKRRATTRLGWAVQWGTVRMLGTFLMEEPTSVPASVVAFVAGQLVEDAEHFAGYGAASRLRTRACGRSGMPTATGTSPRGRMSCGEFLATRVWSPLEGPRALFNRDSLSALDRMVPSRW